MSVLIVPPVEGDGVWPSLGHDVADWQEGNLAFGPGDLLGQPYRLDEEDRALLERAYQVHPPQHAGPCRFVNGRCEKGSICGRRRFDTVVTMTRKGTLKSERLAAAGAAELGEDAPIRCDGFRRQGSVWIPVGRPVTSPFVFLFAFAKEQAEDTSWDAMRQMILRGPGRDKFDVWEERIVRRDGTGEAKPLATAPDSRDGGKTTFQGKEEGHRWTLPRQLEAHHTTVGNLSKRPIAQPWELHATTMYSPGEGSVIEKIHGGIRHLTLEQAHKSRFFFFYRWADEAIQIRDAQGRLDPVALRHAVIDATGPVKATWSDIDGIIERQFLAPDADPDYAERVWLNRGRQGHSRAFDFESWRKLARPSIVPHGSDITLGFDGSRTHDATAIVATDIATGFQWLVGLWQRPPDVGEWEVPVDEVDAALTLVMHDYRVWRMNADPPYWETSVRSWAGQYGKERVIEFWTNSPRRIGPAIRAFSGAIAAGEVTHSGDQRLAAHIGSAYRKALPLIDEDGQPLWTIQKERSDSPHKIDAAMAAVLSWEARTQALKAGVGRQAATGGWAFLA